MDIVDPRIEAYMEGRLRRFDEPVLLEMEAYAEENGFPIVGRIRFHVGDAVTELGQLDGDFDVIFNDIDKDGYPAAWRAASDRIRPGGLYVCDNVLWYGRVAVDDPDDQRPHFTEAVLEHNRLIAEDTRFVSTIVPTRDGVMVAIRIA